MSVDAAVEGELSAQFWKIFEATLGVSANTQYDWNHVSTETKSEQTTVEVEAEAPAGS